MIDYWPGARKSPINAFTGHTGAAPIPWTTPASEAYAKRVGSGFSTGKFVGAAGRATPLMQPPGVSIATAEDKKFKRARGAAI